MALLEVEDLETRFYTEDGVVKAVDGVSYQIDRGERFGVVGESGAGKSVTSLSLMRLIDSPGRIEGGRLKFHELGTVRRMARQYPERIATDDRDGFVHVESGSVDAGAAPAGVDAETPESVARLARDHPDGIAEPAGDAENGNGGDADSGAGFLRIEAGYVDLLAAPDEAMRQIRGGEISMIFQDAQTALNPVYTVGEQIAEAIRTHMDLSDEAVRERTIEMLEQVGIPDPEDRYSDYPHEFSGGMQQRAVIAIALSCDPSLIIADEPTTALDVTIEAQILELLEELSDEFDVAIQLITHDLGVVAELCDRVMVMYAGQAVEKAGVEELYYDPKHPYTVGLMGSIPRIGDDRERLDTIPGTMPDLVELPPGCNFFPRCPYAEEVCTQKEPPLADVETGAPAEGTAPDTHAARCLEYTGDLSYGLGFDVEIDEGTDHQETES